MRLTEAVQGNDTLRSEPGRSAFRSEMAWWTNELAGDAMVSRTCGRVCVCVCVCVVCVCVCVQTVGGLPVHVHVSLSTSLRVRFVYCCGRGC